MNFDLKVIRYAFLIEISYMSSTELWK